MTNILEFLEQSAEKFPDKTAFADEYSSCTYQELLLSAKQIGVKLSAVIRPRHPIPVLAEKSVDVVKVFMGSVCAGCFYVLIDPGQPVSRLNLILETLQPDLLIVDENFGTVAEQLDFIGQRFSLKYLVEADRGSDTNMKIALDSDNSMVQILTAIRTQALDIDPLYAIFTSGSTGVSKGVVVSHRSVIDFIGYFTELFHITDQDVIGNQAPFDFDVSVKDIYSTLYTGATMEIIPKKLFSIPTGLLDYLCDRKITTAIWAVSALCIITTLNGFTYRVPTHLNKILFSGEVMPIKHLNTWRANLPQAAFVNLYGPTEITCNCTYYVLDREFEPGDSLPIGEAFPNESVFVLDQDDLLVEQPGISGELCVSGTALALGYYRDPERTAAVFVQNPLNDSYMETIYRTGDMVHYGQDDFLYFDSRKDFQIKHMGHRIELGEIEAAMEKVPGVERVCCLFLEEKNKIMACYEGEAEKRSIAGELSKTLPRYMIPNIFRQLPVLPVTKNGKVDRAALGELEAL